jgi:hypothetical protein
MKDRERRERDEARGARPEAGDPELGKPSG